MYDIHINKVIEYYVLHVLIHVTHNNVLIGLWI